MTVDLYQLNITQSTFNPNHTTIKFHEKKPNFEIKLVESNIGMSFKYKILNHNDYPELINTTGSGLIRFLNSNITLLSDYKINKSIFQPSVEEVSLFYTDLDL